MGTAVVGVAVAAGFSFACRGEARARACALGPRVGYGGAVVVVGGEGGVEGLAFCVAVIVCDNFDGGRDPYVRRTIVSLQQRLNSWVMEGKGSDKEKGRKKLTGCSLGDCWCGTAGALLARARLLLALSLLAWPSFLLEFSSSSSSSSSSRARTASRRASTQSITRPIESGVSDSDTPCWIIWSRSAHAAAYPELYERLEVVREER